MALIPSDFGPIDKHPFNTFGKNETEEFMAWFLFDSIELAKCRGTNEWPIVETSFEHPEMVKCGFLTQHGERQYRLTALSLGRLFSVYGILPPIAS